MECSEVENARENHHEQAATDRGIEREDHTGAACKELILSMPACVAHRTMLKAHLPNTERTPCFILVCYCANSIIIQVLHKEQKAPLPQRNSASAAHMEEGLGPPAQPPFTPSDYLYTYGRI